MAGRKIGATLALEGEAQFKHAVSAANKELRNMKSSFKLVSEETKGQANTLATLTKKHEALSDVLDAARKKQQLVSDGLENSKANYAKIGASLEAYQKELSEAQAKEEELRNGNDNRAWVDQAIAVSKLKNTVEAASSAYEKAKTSVTDWEGKLTAANTEVVKAEHNLAENDRYLQQAQKSTDHCATAIDSYGKTVKESDQKTQEFGESLTGLSKAQVVSDLFDKIGDAADQLGDKAYDSALALDEGYDIIIEKTGATGDKLTGMTDIADSMYGSMSSSMEDIGSAIGEVNTRFGLQGEQLQSLSTKFVQFAELNGTDVSGSIDTVQKTLEAFGQSSDDAGNLLDAFNKVGQDTGISMDTLSGDLEENAAQFVSMGMSAEDAAGFLGTTEKSGVEVSTMLRGLKTAQKNAASEGKSLNQALSEFSGTMNSNASDTQKLQAAYDLFGSKAGGAIYNACRTGSLSLEDLSTSLEGYAGSVQSTYEATQDPWDKTTQAMHKVQQAGSKLTQTALSTLEPAIEGVGDVVSDATKAFNKLPKPLQQTIAVAGAGAVVFGKYGSQVGSVVQSISALKQAHELASAAEELHAAATAGATTATTAETVAQEGLNAAMEANPIGAVIIAATALGAALGVVVTALSDTGDATETLTSDFYESIGAMDSATSELNSSTAALTETINANGGSVEDTMGKYALALDAADDLAVLANQTSLTSDEQNQMASDVLTLNTLYPELGVAIDSTTGKLNMSTDAIYDNIKSLQMMALAQAYQEEYEQIISDLADVESKEVEAQEAESDAKEKYQSVINSTSAITDAWQEQLERQKELQDEVASGTDDTGAAYEELEQINQRVAAGQVEVNGKLEDYNDAATTAADAASEYETAQNNTQEATDAADQAIADAKDKLTGYVDAANEAGVTIPGVTDATNAQADAMNNATDAANGYAGATGSVTSANATQGDSFDQLATQIQDDLDSASNTFKQYESDSDVTLQSMADALQSQTEAYNNYSSNIIAATSDARYGTDENFTAMVDSIMNMGMDGADYMQQFVDAMNSDDGSLESILDDFGSASEAKDNLVNTFSEMGDSAQDSVDSMSAAFSDGTGQVSGAAGDMADAAVAAANGYLPSFGMTGTNAVQNFAFGLTGGTGKASGAGKDVSNSANGGLKGGLAGANIAGLEAGSNFAKGVGSRSGASRRSGDSLASAAGGGMKNFDSYTAGSNMGGNFAAGLSSMVGKVASAAQSLAAKVSQYLHHSTPDIGPLADDDTWGGEFVDNFASGMTGKIPEVERASRLMASAAAVDLSGTAIDINAGIMPGSKSNQLWGEGNTINLTINGMKYNSDEYIDKSIYDFMVTMIRKGEMYSG